MSRRLLAATLVLCIGIVVVTSAAARPETGVRVRVLRFVDRSREAHFSDGTSGSRVLVTQVRFSAGATRPAPLVVFAHGFALTPDPYASLLDAWVRAGYVVAAPVFPVESANARGGPSQRDLVNEPRDLTFVLSRLVARPRESVQDLSLGRERSSRCHGRSGSPPWLSDCSELVFRGQDGGR